MVVVVRLIPLTLVSFLLVRVLKVSVIVLLLVVPVSWLVVLVVWWLLVVVALLVLVVLVVVLVERLVLAKAFANGKIVVGCWWLLEFGLSRSVLV